MKRNRMAPVCLAVLMALILAAVPVHSQGGVSPEQPAAAIDGPSEVHAGDSVKLTVSAAADIAGMSADIQAEGLEFETVSSGMCSSHCMVLLPLMGSGAVTYTYTVSAPPGSVVSFKLANLTVSTDSSCQIGAPACWSLVVAGCAAPPADPAEAGPPSSAIFVPPTGENPPAPDESPAAAAAQTAEPVPAAAPPVSTVAVRGPEHAFMSDTVQLVVATEGAGAVSREIQTTGLTFVRVTGSFCTSDRLELFAVPGMNTAVYSYRVTGAVGSTASFALSGQPAVWERTVLKSVIASADASVTLAGEAADAGDGVQIIYDLAGTGQEVTAGDLSGLLRFPTSWSLEIRDGADQKLKKPEERLCTGDSFVFRNTENNQVLSGCIVLRGDLAGRGWLDITQVALLAASLSRAGTQLIPQAQTAGDLNCSGSLDVGDLVQLCRLLSAPDRKVKSPA